MNVRVENGKYEFREVGDVIDVRRHGELWATLHNATTALGALMRELDAARAVLLACRSFDGPLPGDIAAALNQHRALVDDNELPSEWTGP